MFLSTNYTFKKKSDYLSFLYLTKRKLIEIGNIVVCFVIISAAFVYKWFYSFGLLWQRADRSTETPCLIFHQHLNLKEKSNKERKMAKTEKKEKKSSLESLDKDGFYFLIFNSITLL